MLSYKEYELAVFNWLLEKHKNDPGFNFSLRQKGSKGAELDYFIGKESSKYFGTTFWNIPVAYPGSAMDLIDVFFKQTKENKFTYYFEFNQRKTPHNTQNELALELIRNVKEEIRNQIGFTYESPLSNAMENYKTKSPKVDYDDLETMLADLDKDLQILFPIIDKGINDIKVRNSNFVANRITSEEFEYMNSRLQNRFIKFGDKKEKENMNDEIIFKKEPLNQILFGPPGTGKTYNSINKALQIIEGISEVELNKKYSNRTEIKNAFDNLIITDFNNPKGQIAFTTFHQSMSYEDFIEGIKPIKPLADERFLKYDIQPGLFYLISEIARSNFENSKEVNKGKLSFEEAFEKLKEELELNPEMKFSMKTKGYDFTIIGFTNSSIQFKKASGGTGHTLSINTLKEIYYGKEFNFKQGVGIYYLPVLNKIQSYQNENNDDVKIKNYVIIIDEINRGNVSQIFGELITLIEDDKRLGKDEALEAILPYSKAKFGVPPNLYIIGTMNTADRSVEALDAALRRRFNFIEMKPKPELLTPQRKLYDIFWKYKELDWEDEPYYSIEKGILELSGLEGNLDPDEKLWLKMEKEGQNLNQINYFDIYKFNGINLMHVLTTINMRIEVILDKDHQIGHSYFIAVNSLDDLKAAFQNKIIPLLQEYFFGDYGKIGLVLGKGFVEKNPIKSMFADFDSELASELSERPIYTLNNALSMDDETFKAAIRTLVASK